jgi:hypothetical protein
MTAKLDLEIKAIESEIALVKSELSKLPRGTKTSSPERKKLNGLEVKLKLRRNKRKRIDCLSIMPWDIVRFISEAEGTVWSTEQAAMWHKELATHEGRGEASLRSFYGLSPAAATTNECDIPERELEAKNVQGRRADGKFHVQMIQAATSGRKAYTLWMSSAFEEQKLRDLSSDVRMAIAVGEVSPGILYHTIPEELRTSLVEAVKPSAVFSVPKEIACTTRFGFLLVPKSDYDRAFVFQNITKCGPKYSLRKEYLIERCRATLASISQAAA